MNKEKYILSLKKKFFLKKKLFKEVILDIEEINNYIVLKKIYKNKDIDNYIRPLKTINNDEGFITRPLRIFDFSGFNQVVDVIAIDSYFRIINLYPNISNDFIIKFENKFHTLIIIKNNSIRKYKFEIGQHIRLKSNK